MSDLSIARTPYKCPRCSKVWEDWKSTTIRRQAINHSGWVWRQLKDFPTIGCSVQLCPECGDNPRKAIKVASGVS